MHQFGLHLSHVQCFGIFSCDHYYLISINHLKFGITIFIILCISFTYYFQHLVIPCIYCCIIFLLFIMCSRFSLHEGCRCVRISFYFSLLSNSLLYEKEQLIHPFSWLSVAMLLIFRVPLFTNHNEQTFVDIQFHHVE